MWNAARMMGLCRRTRTLCQEGLGSDRFCVGESEWGCWGDIGAFTQRWDPETCHEPHLCQHHGPPEPEGLLLRAAGQSELPQSCLCPNQTPALLLRNSWVCAGLSGRSCWWFGHDFILLKQSQVSRISQVKQSVLTWDQIHPSPSVSAAEPKSC